MIVRRTVLMLAIGLVVLTGALAVSACQPSDATDNAPAVEQDQAEESYPGGIPPSQQNLPTPEVDYPGGQRPTDEPAGMPVYNYPAPEEGAEDADDEGESSEEGAAAPDDSSGAVCAAALPGMAVYEDVDAGFCFQHPVDLMVLAPAEGDERQIVTIAPPGSEPGQPAVSGMVFSLEALGPVDALSADDLADELLIGLDADASDLERSEIMIGGELAGVVVDGIPGPMIMRQAFVVQDGNGYTFLIMPWEDEAMPELQDDASEMWQTVMDTFMLTAGEPAPSE